ncbi:MAG: hypothetical protein ACXWEA_01385 [Solirubrobacterales bacterium]
MGVKRQAARTSALAAAATALLLAFPGGAGAVQRVEDGSFENMNCFTNVCTSTVWAPDIFYSGTWTPIGPLCGVAATGINCGSQGGGYVSADQWARPGSGSIPDGNGGYLDTGISQNVLIPASFPPAEPATLSFYVRRVDEPDSISEFDVDIDDTRVFSMSTDTPGYSTAYQQVFINMTPFAGPGVRKLSFSAINLHLAHAGAGDDFSDLYEIDDVSLTAPDAPLDPQPPPAGTPAGTAASGPTGQRAAALAKCKKKKGSARKKCKKRASTLPV